MANILFWLYLVNAIFLINHEIDSAYWKEWELFRIKGGLTGFLIIHFFLLFVILYGLVEVFKESLLGIILSLILCLGGLFAFSIHMFFIKKGKEEFRKIISLFILIGIFIVSIIQIVITIMHLITF